jgi:hypothetical protein
MRRKYIYVKDSFDFGLRRDGFDIFIRCPGSSGFTCVGPNGDA